MRVTCSGAFSRRAANRPANPPPTITTRREPDVAAMARPDLSLCIFIQAWIVMVIARGPLGIALMGVLPTPDHHDEHENRPRGWAVALPRCSGWVRPAIVVEYLNSPSVRDSFAGLEDQQVVAGHEGVRRAGHGLNGYRLAAAVRLQRVAGENLQPAVALVGPQSYPGSRAIGGAQAGPGAAAAVSVQSGERVIKPGGADEARLAEVIRRAFHCGRAPGRDTAIIHGQPERGGQGQLAVIDQGHPSGQVWVRACAVGGCACTTVARGDGDMQPVARMEAVLGVDLQAERICLLAMWAAAEHRGGAVVPDGPPCQPAGQAMDRVRVRGLGEGELELDAVEDVPPAIDSVRPGCQQLAGAAGRQFVGFVAGDHGLAEE